MNFHSPYVTFGTVFRAEVAVPNGVYDAFGHTREYESKNLEFAKLVECSGTDAYGSVVEWGEAPTQRQCEQFAVAWHTQILVWKGQLRSGGAR